MYLSTPAISNDVVYFSPGDYDPNVYALRLWDGKLLWKADAIADAALNVAFLRRVDLLARHSPRARQRILAAVSRQGMAGKSQAAALQPLTTTDRANAFVPLGGSATSSVAVNDSSVFVVRMEYGRPKSRFTLVALDRHTGAVQWRFSELRSCLQLGFCSSPFLSDSAVFVGWGEGKFYALAVRSGAKLWEDSLAGDILSSPMGSNGRVYVATTAGKVVCYQASDPTPPATSFNEGCYSYPNPAKITATIQYYIEKDGDVEARIYDAAERLVKLFAARNLPANTKGRFVWDTSNAANGTYTACILTRHRDGGWRRKYLKIGVLK